MLLHVRNARALVATTRQDPKSQQQTAHNAGPCLVLLLCNDTLGAVAYAAAPPGPERFKALRTLQGVCKRFDYAVRSYLRLAAFEAVDDMLENYEPRAPLLNLSSRNVDRFGCEVLAAAMAHGRLDDVKTLWLQDNNICVAGLQALARGVGQMPADCQLSSIALGSNRFSKSLGRRHPELDRVLEQLDASAKAHVRRISIRLRS